MFAQRLFVYLAEGTGLEPATAVLERRPLSRRLANHSPTLQALFSEEIATSYCLRKHFIKLPAERNLRGMTSQARTTLL